MSHCIVIARNRVAYCFVLFTFVVGQVSFAVFDVDFAPAGQYRSVSCDGIPSDMSLIRRANLEPCVSVSSAVQLSRRVGCTSFA